MMWNTSVTLLALALLTGLAAPVHAADKPIRILYLTKSSGYEHSAVKRDGDKPGYSEKVLAEVAAKMGAQFMATKDASLINAENLKNYDVVMFYTSGTLTETGTDKQPAMGANGVADLVAWVRQGGGFIGIHAATDSFRTEGAGISEYTRLIGAEFVRHGKQFKGTIVKEDAKHAAVKSFPKEWTGLEEWYTFTKFNPDLHVIARLDPGDERTKQEMYNTAAYPFIWCREEGKGRVYYNGLGHREDTVWDNADVQAGWADAIRWAAGQGETKAKPNLNQ